ncbi:MAG: 3-phosphoserine/phosphohydroxythreonine transaminase [Oscillospiraceae bacterium]|nr:3-phosphoserine/phosphohydroxythreonine transaminase [Oscillospiraceae bacterium]
MSRVYNFSAGPSMLPDFVLARVKEELLEYRDTHQSVMEMSHRSKEYLSIIEACEAKFRSMLGVSDDYTVLFLQGGAYTQFAMLPMNLMTVNRTADYLITGSWGEKAYLEGKKFGEARIVASSEDKNFTYIPEIDASRLNPDADFMHFCYNNTIFGTSFSSTPSSIVPLAADVSSMILSKPLDVNDYGILYAGAQKNMGIAGLTVVVIRKDLCDRSPVDIPSMFSYSIQQKNQSMFNTPATFPIYVLSVMLDWLDEEIGGLAAMQKINKEKSSIIYDYLDESNMFYGTVEKSSRSDMNICFISEDDSINKEFCAAATAAGFLNLAGHRSVGGMRASVYNAMPIEGVKALRDFMSTFEKEHK